MDNCVIIVDNSNVWIEGMKLSAKLRGITDAPIEGKDPCDYSWRIDFGRLLTEVSNGRNIQKSLLVGSRPPVNDSLWACARRRFSVKLFNRNFQGKEKAVDAEIVVKGCEIVCTSAPATLILLSGDTDFIPLIKIAKERGWNVEIYAFKTALTHKTNLTKIATEVKYLEDIFEKIGYLKSSEQTSAK